jgi:predicted LPLAT superfamily acyltransferase
MPNPSDTLPPLSPPDAPPLRETRESRREGPPDSPRDWSPRGVGKGWQFAFFHGLLKTLGKRPAYHIMYLVTLWYVLFHPSIRRRGRPYLDRRFPHPRMRTGLVARLRDDHRLLRNFGKTLVDMAAARTLGPSAIKVSCPDQEQLVSLSESDRGLILLHAHVGCWQLALSALSHLRRPVTLLMIPDPKVQPLIDALSGRIIDPRGGLPSVVEMTQVLLRREALSIMGDRVLGDDPASVQAQFLGQPVALPLAPYRLASATGCPILVIFTPKTGFDTYELRLGGIIEVPPGLGARPEAYEPYARLFTAALEQFVEQHPWQFFNFYDLWAAPANGRG